jgi:hypothetical protein
MTGRQFKQRFIGTTILLVMGVSSMAAVASADGTSATTAFFSAAEKFGVFAAMSLALTGFAVFGLWKLGMYVLYRFENVVDDNTLAFLRFARLMERRPCISDSDVDKIIAKEPDEGDSGDAIVQRVMSRRQSRQVRNTS